MAEMNKFIKHTIDEESEQKKKEVNLQERAKYCVFDMGQGSVNSKAYWEKRFKEDWDATGGPRQSRFFARLAIENLPSWLIKQIRCQDLTLADWGCAQGDGTDVWASYVDSRQLVGVDFSRVAIDQASSRYPAIRFVAENWIGAKATGVEVYDVVFSSNTLEHFHRPYEVLEDLSLRARKAVALVLPYRELERGDEHFFSFLPSNIPLVLNNGFRLVWSRVIECSHLPNTPWDGDQILLLYTATAWVDSFNLTLQDSVVEQEDTALKISNLNQGIVERDRQIVSLKAQIQNIWASTSWRITSPLRFLKNMFRDLEQTTYSLLKQIYLLFPVSLQKRLSGLRHIIIRFYVSRHKKSTCVRIDPKGTGDLSWAEFKSKVLSGQEQYKGIFITEATIDWDVPLFQRPQHNASAFAKLGYLAIYKTGNFHYDTISGFRKISENLWITNDNKVDTIRGAIRIFYSTICSHTKEDYAARRKQGIVVYEYIDHIDPAISGDEETVRRLNDLKNYVFNGGVDFIVASAKALYEEAVQAVGEDKVILVPNGVDVEHYRDPRHRYCAIPESLSRFKNAYKAIVGYFGALAPWLWFEEIEKLVALRPDIGFVFIGPDYHGGLALLPKSKNVLRLEPVSYKILPGYALHFDVCFIPFKPGEIARATSPLKLFEYFALEKPVVVTSDMLECVQFPEVLHGGSAEELSKCIDKALDLSHDERFKKRLAKLAEQNSWVERAKKYETVFKKL